VAEVVERGNMPDDLKTLPLSKLRAVVSWTPPLVLQKQTKPLVESESVVNLVGLQLQCMDHIVVEVVGISNVVKVPGGQFLLQIASDPAQFLVDCQKAVVKGNHCRADGGIKADKPFEIFTAIYIAGCLSQN